MKFDTSFYEIFYKILEDDDHSDTYKDSFINHDVHRLNYINNRTPEEIYGMLSEFRKIHSHKKNSKLSRFQKNCIALIVNKHRFMDLYDRFCMQTDNIFSEIVDIYKSYNLDISCLEDVTVYCTAGSPSNAKTDYNDIMIDLTYPDLDIELKTIKENLLHECFHIIHHNTLCFKAMKGELYTMILDFTYIEGLANFFANYISHHNTDKLLNVDQKRFFVFFDVLKRACNMTMNRENKNWIMQKLYYNAGPVYSVGEYMAAVICNTYGVEKLLEATEKGHFFFLNTFLSTGDAWSEKMEKYAKLPEVRIF